MQRLASLPFLAALALASASCDGCDPEPETCLPRCTATRSYDARAYHLRARFDWERQRLVASEDVTLALKTASEADAVVALDAEVTVSDVRAGDRRLGYHVDEETNEALRVDLTPVVAPGAEVVTFTVEYEAEPSDSLRAVLPGETDPVRARVVFTDSEPDRGRRWLVARHDPSDRALWSVDLEVGAGEDAIANGERVSDVPGSPYRTVGHALAQPIPTYLMAFAAGELEHTDRPAEGDGTPLSLWYRRGLVVDPADNLDMVAEQMATFERLLGPYPFNRYTVVLVPQYGGGMENATITFNGEASGQGNVSFGLNAHELAHHWFGDLVTMRTYDDAWVKEGMATLLQAEATRARRDRAGTGRGFGTDFNFSPDDAIVDPTLTGYDKYTSGLYERAAWTITQIRVRIGEEAFWASIRRLLEEHAFADIDGESFVRAFAPALPEEDILKVLGALEQKAVPVIVASAVPNPARPEDSDVTISVDDPGAVLIAPIEVTVVDAAGSVQEHVLGTSGSLTVTVPAGGYIAPDEKDIHPYWTSSFDFSFGDFANLLPLMVPTAPAAVETFAARSPSHQERALNFEAVLLAPAELGGFHEALDSDLARRLATQDACTARANAEDSAAVAAWEAALGPLVLAPAQQQFNTRLGPCGVTLPTEVLGDELDAALASPTAEVLDRLEYLMSFDYGAARSLAAFAPLATSGPSLRLRSFAMSRLSAHAQGGTYSAIGDDERDPWRTFFRARLAEVQSESQFYGVWYAVLALADVEALPVAAPLLHRLGGDPFFEGDLICQAFDLTVTAGTPDAWTAFQAAAQPWADLTPEAQGLLADPATCANR